MDDLMKEVEEIGFMLREAGVLLSVRKSLRGAGIVEKASAYGLDNRFDVVVSGSEASLVGRRVRSSMPDARVEIIADRFVGVSGARRG